MIYLILGCLDTKLVSSLIIITNTGQARNLTDHSERSDSHLVAALGFQWAHAITVRLIFEAHSGKF